MIHALYVRSILAIQIKMDRVISIDIAQRNKTTWDRLKELSDY